MPDVTNHLDSPLTVGLRFRSDVAGSITGIRFYKSAINTGSFTVLLYTNTGSLLAQAAYPGSSAASGWQQVSFSSPVAISPNTTYVAAYFSTSGFVFTDGYFVNSGVDNAPLHALRTAVGGLNGVFQYGSVVQFPTASYNGMNYWVDVLFVGN
jgi:hypothetical protein